MVKIANAPKVLLIFKSVIPTGDLALFSRHTVTLVSKFAELPIPNSEEFEVGNGKQLASSKPTTEFAQPRLSRSNGGPPQQEGAHLGVCLFLYGWSCPGVRLQIWVCLIYVTCIKTQLVRNSCAEVEHN